MTKRSKPASGHDDPPLGKLLRTPTWAGVHKGDPVEVMGTHLRSAEWEFVAHVRNVRTGDEWIEVVGGRRGDRTPRSFSPDRVFAPAPKQGRRSPRASLADQPMLPLD